MPNTFDIISSVTVPAGGTSAVNFTSSPSTYADLCLKVSARKTTSGGINLQMRFNDSTSGYIQRTIIAGNGNVVTYFDNSEIGFMYVTSSSDTANTFSSTEMYIPSYSSSNNKSVGINNVTENNASASTIAITAAAWANSAAINKIYLQIANGAGVFAEHSTIYLYGIKKS